MKKALLSICVIVIAGGILFFALQKQIRPYIASAPQPEHQASLSTDAGPAEPLKLPLKRPKIVVIKSARQLMLYSDDKLVRIYQIGLGFNPTPDKIKEGDGATPEGEFYIFTKNDRSAFYLSLGISYPNVEDAERGLRDGLITQDQYKQIVEAIKRKAAPPQNTPLGGDIYIHGNGSHKDWTWGCVALDDKDIKELFEAVAVGAKVIVEH